MRRLLLAALCAGLILASPAAGADPTHDVTKTFSFTASEQTWVVPPGVTSITVHAVGGKGAIGYPVTGGANGSTGGYGADVQGDLTVTPGQTLHVEVAGNAVGIGGGWNGGGNSTGGCCGGGAGAGGGASDVRDVSGDLSSRRIVAGGGGGGGGIYDPSAVGGNGGNAGAVGADGGMPSGGSLPGFNGGGGTAAAGGYPGPKGVNNGTDGGIGTLGNGGAGGVACPTGCNDSPRPAGGGGGGGGLYGGGGGGAGNGAGGGAGGGSSLVPGGGSASTDATGTPKVTITYQAADKDHVLALAAPSSLPADGASQTTVTAYLVDYLDRPIGDAGAGEAVTFTSSDPGVQIGSATDNGDGTYSATVTASVYAGTVTITAHDGALTDDATVTQTCPNFCVTGVSPGDLATQVGGYSAVEVTFTTSPSAKAGKAFFFTSTGKKVAGKATIAGNTLDFYPSKPLVHGQTYTAHVAGGNEKKPATDVSGNGLFAPVTVSFTVDDVAPTIFSTDPTANATNVPLADNIVISFTEGMNGGSVIKATTVTGPGGKKVAVKAFYGSPGILSLDPTKPLAPGTVYQVRVVGGLDAKGKPAGATDAAGNPLAATVTWQFTTAP